MTDYSHTTVMLQESVDALRVVDGGVYVDCTLGGGGHAERILQTAECRVIGIDRDEDALDAARARLAPHGDRFQAVHSPFSELPDVLDRLGVRRVDGVLADLGVSSHQLDTDDRGFSFRRSGPIDMRMDRSTGPTAADVVNEWSAQDLADVIKRYGEERLARRIARKIVAGRPWDDTVVLADAIRSCFPGKQQYGRIHAATRTFQAIRIAVNDELGELERLLHASVDRLVAGGHIAIISFHSLEDRIVKRFFAAQSGKTAPRDPWGHPIGPVHLQVLPPQTPSPPQPPEVANPRARSARLRVARRLPWNTP